MKRREVTFVTPTFRGDLDRFRLQRESIERCGIEIPHVAVVQHEDLELFRREIPFTRGLTLLSTRDVLPPRIERRRAACQIRRRNPRRWFVRPLHGWFTQQIVKLASPAVVDTEGIVCLDADVFFVRRAEHDDFFDPDGRLHLYATDDIDAEMAEWLVDSMRFLGIPLRSQRLTRYIHHVIPLHRQVLLDMQEYISRRSGKHWADAIAEANVFEYPTYGAYAAHLYDGKGIVPVHPTVCVNYWWPDQVKTMEQDFTDRIRTSPGKAVLVQSNFGLPASGYRHLAEGVWPKAGRPEAELHVSAS